MNAQSPAALGSTEDYLFLCHRLSNEAFELTPTFDKYTNNMQTNTPVSMAGVIPISAIINGKSVQWTYKAFAVNTAISADETVTLNPLDYAQFDEGTYYLNTSTGEYFFCLSKNTNWSVTFRRGLVGTTKAAINISAILYKLNTIRLDTATGSETRGKFTMTAGTTVMETGDKLTIVVDGVVTELVFGTDISVSTTLADQATSLRNTLAQIYRNWEFATSTNDVIATQRSGYGKPFTVSVTSVVATSTSEITGAVTTAGVAKSYESGYGVIIFKEMPRNIAYGQKNYPTAYT